MLNLAIVVFLAAGTVLAQNEALAVQKEDWCFSYIECYETNPECAVEYCNGPPTLGPCTVATEETEPYQIPDAPIRNECCQQSNPYECYRNWAASQSPGSPDGSAGLEGNAPVPTSSVIIQSIIPNTVSSVSSTSVSMATTTSLTNPTSSTSSALAVTSGSTTSETATQSIARGSSSTPISTSTSSTTTSIPSTITVNAGPTIAPYGHYTGLYVIGGLALAIVI